MSRQLGLDLVGVLKGARIVLSESFKVQEDLAKQSWHNSSIKTIMIEANDGFMGKIKANINDRNLKVEYLLNETLERSSMVPKGVKAFVGQFKGPKKEYIISDGELIEYDQDKIYENLDSMLQGNVTNVEKIESNPSNTVEKINQNNSLPILEEKKLEANMAVVGGYGYQGFTAKIELRHSNDMNKIEGKDGPTYLNLNKIGLSNSSEADKGKQETLASIIDHRPRKNAPKMKQNLSEAAKERKVPASRIGRMISFGTLAAGLGIGTMAEVARRSLGIKHEGTTEYLDSAFLTPANAERIVDTLCKVRGAALKIGQLLSIQDNNIVSPVLQQAFERVRQAADFMPVSQVEKVLRSELGDDWREKFVEFNMVPFAAASIGQVHLGKIPNGTEVAVKIQYPGVAKGIDSDIDNLVSVLNIWNMFPEGMYIDKLIEVAKRELSWEIDYVREAECTRKFKKLLEPYPEYYVPEVIDNLCTKQVFTTELIEGIPVDKCADMDIEDRKHICGLIMQLCLRELFQFRYMQTDPNWSNFFYNPQTKKLILLDFGASRGYTKAFMDEYIKVIKAASEGDRERVLKLSQGMGFLTGFESKAMEQAHVDTVMILGEVFSEKAGEFDFGNQDTTLRVTKLVPTILNHRLCPPPEEIYSLHRKLSGVFLLCSKLKVKMECRGMFEKVYNNYIFD